VVVESLAFRRANGNIKNEARGPQIEKRGTAISAMTHTLAPLPLSRMALVLRK
jgi:hypothetical protein